MLWAPMWASLAAILMSDHLELSLVDDQRAIDMLSTAASDPGARVRIALFAIGGVRITRVPSDRI